MKHWPKVWPVFCESKELLIKTKTLTKKPRHRTRCLLRSKTKLRTEYSATEAILSLLCSKVFIVTSHLAQEAKCSQLFVTMLYPPPPPPPPPAADPPSKPSTELRALSTTFYFQTTMKTLPTSTDDNTAHLFTMKGWKLDVSRVVDSCPARCPDWPQRFYKHPGKVYPDMSLIDTKDFDSEEWDGQSNSWNALFEKYNDFWVFENALGSKVTCPLPHYYHCPDLRYSARWSLHLSDLPCNNVPFYCILVLFALQ